MVATCHKAGILLAVTDDKQLRVEAPRGALTPELRAALVDQKPTLLAVLSRLEAMRATAGQAPIIVANPQAVGGPGRCCSCGDALDAPRGYGRCAACDVAVDAYYATLRDDTGGWGEV